MKRLALLALIPAPAFAHQGDHNHSGLLHLLTEPDHLLLMGLAVAAVVYVFVKVRR
jgi:hydrogenase/urease accessory protein HupE